MSTQMVHEPVELRDDELDLVTGGLALSLAGGLVNVPLSVNNVSVLSNDNLTLSNIASNNTIKNIANNNNLSVGAIIQLLGGGAAIANRQSSV